MEHHERMRVRHSHWGIVSVPALAVMLSIGVMPGQCRTRHRSKSSGSRLPFALRSMYAPTLCRFWRECRLSWSSATRTLFGTVSSRPRLPHGPFALKAKASRYSGGKGIEGVHLDPGKTLVIRLTPEQQGKITFRGDLNPSVQGEVYLLDVPVG